MRLSRSLAAFPFARAALLAAALLPAMPAIAETYSWRPDRGTIRVFTDRGGLFSRMGHRHEILAQSFIGTMEFDATAVESTRFNLVIAAASLKVLDPKVEADDIAKIQHDMETKVLEVAEFPEIRFLSNVVSIDATADSSAIDVWRLRVSGTLALHGTSQPASFPVVVAREGRDLRVKGETLVRQKDFEIEPISVGLGAVNVKNEVRILFDLIAAAPDSASAPR